MGKILVYHADRKFDGNFDMSKIGSGDGKALGGWGLYFSGDIEVSQRYTTKHGSLFQCSIKDNYYLNLDESPPSWLVYDISVTLSTFVNEYEVEQFNDEYVEYYYEITGKQLYDWLSSVLGGDKQASLFLLNLGIIGTTFFDKVNIESRNYVLFSDEYIYDCEIIG